MRINVTLTASSNEYLRYPVNGSLEICEMSTDEYIIVATFLQTDEAGKPVGGRVVVRNPKFEYKLRGSNV